MRDLPDKLRQQFDLVLVDSPPVTVSAEGLVIARHVDGVVLVVEADNTRWSVAKQVKARIIEAEGNILGVLFNKQKSYIPTWILNVLP